MVGKHLPRSPPLNALTLLLDAITSSRWRCRYTNFYQLCDTTTGTAAGALLLRRWPDASRLPLSHRLAYGVAIAGALLSVAGFAAVASRYPRYAILASLTPKEQMPTAHPEIVARAADLVVRYPRDPRSHMFQSVSLLAAHDLSGAEQELRTALQQAEAHKYIFGRQFEHTVQGSLALVLFESSQQSQAQDLANIACNTPQSEQPAAAVRKLPVDRKLCD